MAKKKITDELALEMFQKYCDGVMQKDLAKQYGVSRSTVEAAFYRRGLKRSETPRYMRAATCSDCPEDCRFLMTITGGNETHCGYILFDENGPRGCDVGAGCVRYEPKKKGR